MRRADIFRSILAAAAACVAASAFGPASQGALGLGPGGSKSNEPVAIEAEEGIEWQQTNQVYIARGNARATQAGASVRADSLTAHYRNAKSGETEIWKIVAEGSVRIESANEWATGDVGVYDVDKGVLVLTGKIVRYETASEKISARQSIEYWDTRRLAVARGNAVAIKDGRELRGDVLSAELEETKGGALEVRRIQAFGNVEVASPTEVAKAEYGDYRVETGIAHLQGSVKITRGANQLNGDLAEVNMKTGVSKLLAQPRAAGGSKRVQGLIIPKTADGPTSSNSAPKSTSP
ncbi:MAG: LptA/OstA family protein [Alphaproteobacteria bacterium]